MTDSKSIYSIAVHLDSGVTLNGYVYHGNEIDDGFWLTYSRTADMGNAVSVSREKIQYFEITGVANAACGTAQGLRNLGDLSLRRCGCCKFSAPNYADRAIPQLRELLKDLTGEYMNNRDIEWFSEQSRLIDAAAQVAYSKGRY